VYTKKIKNKWLIVTADNSPSRSLVIANTGPLPVARAVAEVVKAYARRAGFKAADFSGHSLRSGFLTSAAARGASIFKMMDVSRHKSIETLRGYIRDSEMFRDHAGTGLL
jgi:site-specific recombinase XerD